MSQFNVEKATGTFLEQELVNKELEKMDQDSVARAGDFDFNTILEKETEEAYADSRRSPSSPIYEVPTIDSIKGLLDPNTIKEIDEYLQSGAMTRWDIGEIAAIAHRSLARYLKEHPEHINNEEQKKDIWQRVFIAAIKKGRTDQKKSGGKRRSSRKKVPRKYIPKRLTKKDKRKQSRELKKSRKAYKKGKYYTRKKVKSFKSKVSPHIVKARKMYKIKNISASPQLARKTGCSVSALRKIIKKGQGAYYSSGSRPNQTGHSWGRARLASSITGGKAAAVDYHILEKGCKKNSKALRLAKRVKSKGTRRVKKTFLGGYKMKEKIVKFKKGPFPKKYTALIKNNKTKKIRKLHFGDRRYQQFKDRTPLKLYKSKNHGTRKRMQNYFSRHSGTKNRKEAIQKERRKSRGNYNAKILSHEYLW